MISIAIIVIDRPRSASIPLTALYMALCTERLVVLSSMRSLQGSTGIASVTAGAAALLGVLVVLNMPLRDASLPVGEISPVFAAPTAKLRTPEDNLTPWQFMSVSWLSPLIAKGMTRKIDDEDVWDLGFDFKHARLHSAFRTLRGSVTKRLLVANGMDLVRTTLLAFIQLAASKFAIPICL